MLCSSSDTRQTQDASILVYEFRPERTGFNMYAEYTQPQLTFLSLVPCLCYSDNQKSLEKEVDSSY